MSFSVYPWRPLRYHDHHRVLFPNALQILLKLVLAGAYPRQIVSLGDPHALVSKKNRDPFELEDVGELNLRKDFAGREARQMPIPDFQTLMLPLLKFAADGNEHYIREAINNLAAQFGLTEHELKELLPSGADFVFENRVRWARTYLKKAGLIQYTKRGYFQITDRGRTVLSPNPPKINIAFLRQFPEFRDFHAPKKSSTEDTSQDSDEDATETPEEILASEYLSLRKQVEGELLARVKACPPEFFERLVVRLLTTIGYGGSLADAGRAIGKSGDGGIDGVIKEDKLGLDILYIQAKRWDTTTVGRPEIQKFVGALYGKKAKKGISMTTSAFSKDARDYADGLDSKVVLIDGTKLAELMFEHGVGVATVNVYSIKRIDADFFEEEVPVVLGEATVKAEA